MNTILNDPKTQVDLLKALRQTAAAEAERVTLLKLQLDRWERDAEIEVLLSGEYDHLKNAEARKAQVALLVKQKGGDEAREQIAEGTGQLAMRDAEIEESRLMLKLHLALVQAQTVELAS